GLVRQPRGTVRLRVAGLPATGIASVRWQIDDGPFQPFAEQASEDEAASYAQEVKWKRGDHQIRVEVRTREQTAQPFTRDLAVRYVPPPPEIVPRGAAQAKPGQVLKVDGKDDFPLEATVRPGAPGEKVLIELYHQHALLTPAPAAPDVSRKIKLRPGKNRIELIAAHKDALAGAAALEPARLELDVLYTPPKPPEVVPAPLITLDAVVPLIGGNDPGAPLEIAPGRPVIVAVPRVRLLGTIKGIKALAGAQRDQGG